MTIKDYRELRVYQMAFKTAMEIFSITKSWPAEEKYSLTDQIRRSSRSICANVAEAWRKRRYPNSFVSKLNDAETEASETLVWIEFACACEYLDPTRHARFRQTYDHICAQLVTMINQSNKWCGK